MITLITGAPGTGKTAALVSLLRELSKDRLLYVCNLDGLKIDHVELKDAATWHTDVPDGAVVCIDEVQHFWRPRGPGQKVPEYIAALETHRHRGLDFYIITQGPNLLDANVRALVGRHVHLRELGVLGRWWYEWPECADNCRTAWKNAPIKKRYRLPKKNFADYTSASVHIKPKRSFPFMLVVLVAAIAFGAWKAWDIYGTVAGKLKPATAAKPAGSPGAAPGQPVAPSAVPGAAPAYSGGQQKVVIDDRVDWIPRVSNRPESAPAYDGIRTVASMPQIVGAIWTGKRVRCVTQQGTTAQITEAECRAWAADPPFNPYAQPKGDGPPSPSASGKNAPQDDLSPALVALDGSGGRDPQGKRTASK